MALLAYFDPFGPACERLLKQHRQRLKKSLLIMKMAAFLILVACLQVSAKTYSQKVTLSLKNAPLKTVFVAINEQTGYNFLFSDEVFLIAGKVTIDVKDASIQEVLNKCFVNQPLTFTVIDNSIVVKEKPAYNEDVLTVALSLNPPNHEVHGQVVDLEGKPVSGINVTVKGGKQVAVTNEKGEFTVTGVNDNSVLIFTAVNLETTETIVGDRTSITLTLKTKRSVLDDVQIIGYGSTTKRLNTGSMGSVTSAEIQNQPVVNPLMALEGRVAGVEMNVTSGEPGAPIDIKIRGQNTSFAATSYPLFIIDGIPVPYSTGYDYAANNPLNSINPGDVENITILKDADATAVYGSRGANGVVLITTKKGKAGAMVLNLDLSTGFSQAARLTKSWLKTPEYLAMRKQAFINDGITPDEENAPDLTLWSQTAYTDWQKEILGNTGSYTNVQASVSGGDERVRYLISGAYNYNQGIVWGDNYDKRASLHVNVENNSKNKRFQMSTNLTYSNDNIRKSGDNSSTYLVKFSPNLPHYDSTGAIYASPDNSLIDNPLFIRNQYTTNNTDNILANTKLGYLILPNLNLSANIGYTKQSQNGFQAYPSTSLNPILWAGYRDNFSNFLTQSVETFVTEPQLDYNTHLGKGKLQLMLGGTWQSTNAANTYISGYNYSSDELLSNVGAASGVEGYRSGGSTYKYQSVFLRANYNWNEKYLLNGSFRRDGSSRFGEGYKFGNFWSASAAWIFTNESFFKDGNSFLNYGKIRGSYGLTGNDQIGDYQYLAFYAPTGGVYNNVAGIYSSQVINNQYRWEQTYKGDIGLELGAFNSRVLLTVDYFNNKSENLLTSIPLAAQAGYSHYTGNLPAVVQNKGWEFSLSTVNIKNRDFKWQTTFNLTLPKNILVAFPGLENSPYANSYEVGRSIRIVKEVRFAGISPDNGGPLFYHKDGTITDGTSAGGGVLVYPTDDVYIGNLDPTSFGGLGNIFNYKGFELNVFFQFSCSKTNQSFLGVTGPPIGSMSNTGQVLINDVWTKPGQQASQPALTTSRSSAVGQQFSDYSLGSSANYVDNSYIRLKTLALTWSMPSSWSDKVKLSNVRVYVQAQNLITFTSYTYFDPESTNYVPVLKTVTFGIRASL